MNTDPQAALRLADDKHDMDLLLKAAKGWAERKPGEPYTCDKYLAVAVAEKFAQALLSSHADRGRLEAIIKKWRARRNKGVQKWVSKHPDRKQKLNREWDSKNRERRNQIQRDYRARKKEAIKGANEGGADE